MKTREKIKNILKGCLVNAGEKIHLLLRPTLIGSGITVEQAKKHLKKCCKKIKKLQYRFFEQKTKGMLIILQGLDTAGKGGTVKRVLDGNNPEGVKVFTFVAPTPEENSLPYLVRFASKLPKKGEIVIWERSPYEDVTVPFIHPEYLAAQAIPPEARNDALRESRLRQIADFERMLAENGIIIRKIFLNVGWKEQLKRLLSRTLCRRKQGKVSDGDIRELGYFEGVLKLYSDAISKTSTTLAPWIIIGADSKPHARMLAAEVILDALVEADPQYREIAPERMDHAREAIKAERKRREAMIPKVKEAAKEMLAAA